MLKGPLSLLRGKEGEGVDLLGSARRFAEEYRLAEKAQRVLGYIEEFQRKYA